MDIGIIGKKRLAQKQSLIAFVLLSFKTSKINSLFWMHSKCPLNGSKISHCGARKKKKLSQRWHECACGARAQRDLFSAHLACHVKNNRLDIEQASIAWPAVEPLLERAVSRLKELTSGKNLFSSFGLGQRQRQSHAKERSLPVEAMDVVSSC